MNEPFELTQPQEEVLGALCALIDERDVPPTSAEISARTSLSADAVFYHVRTLLAEGLIVRHGRRQSARFFPVRYPDGRVFPRRRDLIQNSVQ